MNISPFLKKYSIIIFAIFILGIMGWVFAKDIDENTKRNHEIKSVLTDYNTREIGIDALKVSLGKAQKENVALRKDLEDIKKELIQIRNKGSRSTVLNEHIIGEQHFNLENQNVVTTEGSNNNSNQDDKESISNDDALANSNQILSIDELNKKLDKLLENEEMQRDMYSSCNLETEKLDTKEQVDKNKLDVTTNEITTSKDIQAAAMNLANTLNENNFRDDEKHNLKAKSVEIRVLSRADKNKSNKISNYNKEIAHNQKLKKKKYQKLKIPSGSILSGILITGLDAPTKQNSRSEPFPVLINLDKNALLPNDYKLDLKECFVIAAGYGDMSSERVYLRAESLSCITKRGNHIEQKLNAYAVGEDGKAGLRGRLVSKQGKLIARSLWAGFLEGLGGAFDVSPIPVINNSSHSSSMEYQRVYNPMALEGALVNGSSKALDRIASFYLRLAQDMFPVLEIDAARRVDLVLNSSCVLKLDI